MPKTTGPNSLIRFGVFEVDIRAGELRSKGSRVKLPFKEKSPDIAYFLKADLRIDPLRSDVRFRNVVRRVGLPQ